MSLEHPFPQGPRRVHWSDWFSWVSLDKSKAGRGAGAGRAHGQQQLPSCLPPQVDGSGCGVASMALQGPHPGPEVGVHGQQAHEGQGVEHHTEADVQVREVPLQHLQPLASAP